MDDGGGARTTDSKGISGTEERMEVREKIRVRCVGRSGTSELTQNGCGDEADLEGGAPELQGYNVSIAGC